MGTDVAITSPWEVLVAAFVPVMWDEADTAICHSLRGAGFVFMLPLTFFPRDGLPLDCCSLNLSSQVLFFLCLACQPGSL